MRRLFRYIWNFFFQHFILKCVSLVFAAMLWGIVTHQRTMTSEVTRTVQIEFTHAPQDLVRISTSATSFQVTLFGSRRLFKTTEFDALTYPIDLSQATIGYNTYKIYESKINGLPPKEVDIRSIMPSEISILFERGIKKQLPVTVRFHGQPPPEYEMTDKTLNPASVELWGAASELLPMEEIFTEPINLAGRNESFDMTALLDFSGKHIFASHQKTIALHVSIAEKRIERRIDIPVQIRGQKEAQKVDFQPDHLSIMVQGSIQLIPKLTPNDFELFIDISDKTSGTFSLVPTLKHPRETKIKIEEIPEISVQIETLIPPPTLSPQETATPSAKTSSAETPEPQSQKQPGEKTEDKLDTHIQEKIPSSPSEPSTIPDPTSDTSSKPQHSTKSENGKSIKKNERRKKI